MSDTLVFLLVLLAVAAGFGLGVYQGQFYTARGWRRFIPVKKRRQYFTELSHLLSGQADAGIETFTQHFKVMAETVEIHFAVGDLLRKRGEVDRAIEVHQNILSSTTLSVSQLEQAQLALALDYLAAGLLDRAEILLKPLSSVNNSAVKVKSLEGLASIYEQEQEWQKAVAAADARAKLAPSSGGQAWRDLQAHFFCELSEQASRQKLDDKAKDYLGQAIDVSPTHARANSLLIAQYCSRGEINSAIKALNVISPGKGNADDILTHFRGLTLSAEQSNSLKKWVSQSQRTAPSLNKALFLADLVATEFGESAGMERLCAEASFDTKLAPILQVIRGLPSASVSYSSVRASLLSELNSLTICAKCGFESQQFYWRCPTCKTWH